MKIIIDNLWFCVDCMIVAVNGDLPTESTPERDAKILAGLEKHGPHLVPNFDTETGKGHLVFSNCGCDCCGSRAAGEMHRFAVLG